MSQAGLIDIEASHPQIATSFTTDSGTAIPIDNDLEILGGDGISTSASGKTVTVTLDNPIATSLGGTGLASPTDGAILVGNGSSAVELVGPLTDGQLLIGDTSGVSPVAATLTAGTGMTITNGAGSISLSAAGGVAMTFAGDSGTAAPAANIITMAGGTGLTSSASGSTVTFDLDSPVSVANGGTGAASLTDGGLLLGSGVGAVTVLGQATHGQLPIGSTGADPVLSTITAGSGISVTNGAGSITIDNTAGGFTWNETTGTSASLAVQNGYIANNAGLITFTLPATAALGEAMQIVGKGAGLYKLAQNAGQTVHIVASSTTTGTGGSLTAIEQYASMEIICITANTDFIIADSSGNFTVV